MSNDKFKIAAKTALLASGAALFYIVLRHRSRLLNHVRYLRNPLHHKRIEIIETADDCSRVVDVLKKHCASYKVLGFDCEWVTVGGQRRPTALLQLSSHEGLCALFRLCCMQQIPKSLRELLEDEEVIKVGVAPYDDAQQLCFDYGVGVANTLDLRFFATLAGFKPEGLAKLSKTHLNVQLDKNWRLACSDWEAKVLTETQLEYAANDALVAVEIFKRLVDAMQQTPWWWFKTRDLLPILQCLEPYYDTRFKDSFVGALNSKGADKKKIASGSKRSVGAQKNMQYRKICTRSKILYDNCLLEAPDGEVLCTIDRKKAVWYKDNNLGVEIKSEPLTVRLNFEPASRSIGEAGRYYQTPKENQCVVCGRRDVYIRKNVVPREYRKHFPLVMKNHTSHDVLLLCPPCHQRSNVYDCRVRQELGKKCHAPVADSQARLIEVPELKKVKSAARALLRSYHQLPEQKREEFQRIVLAHFNEDEISQELVVEAAEMNILCANEDYYEHGKQVVQKFQTEFGGLVELERVWREHFIKTMKPRFLPPLWSIDHNAARLEIRAHEGRVDKDDLIAAGLDGLCTKETREAHLENP